VIWYDEVINSSRHAADKSVTLCRTGGIDVGEIAPTAGPNPPAIDWGYWRGRRRRFSFKTFTFGFFGQRRQWCWSRPTLMAIGSNVGALKIPDCKTYLQRLARLATGFKWPVAANIKAANFG
jgi:hypothetical protein